jgi:thiol-disulfide isomerase/thioredoxin
VKTIVVVLLKACALLTVCGEGDRVDDRAEDPSSSPPIPSAVSADITDYRHFTGRYAYEATPGWVEFEIVWTNNGFSLHEPNGSKVAELEAVEGALVDKEKQDESLSIRYDRGTQRYILELTTVISTFEGDRPLRLHRAVRKVTPVPDKALERQVGVTAAALVTGVRQAEQWIHECTSLRYWAHVAWTRAPVGIEYRKREILAQYPEADLSRALFWGLAPREEGTKEICFDRRRFRVTESYWDKSDQILAWDGQTFTAYTKYYTHPQEEYLVDPDLGHHGTTLLADLAWPRAQAHRFWWQGEAQKESNPDDWDGRPEDFVLAGIDDYRGVQCYVLECRPRNSVRVHRWFVGVDDRRLRGLLVFEEGARGWEWWMDAYREVRRGWWFPMVHGFHRFVDLALLPGDQEGAAADGADSIVAERHDVWVDAVEVDLTLGDEDFRVEFKEGVKVHDLRFGGMVTYRYKKEMSEEEWESIRTEAIGRAEGDATRKHALDSLIGQVPPPFPAAAQWLNSPPLCWATLRGKVVVMQFWSRNCGPCHAYIRLLKAADADADLVVIGIHPPEIDTAAVRQLLARHQADGPVCIDVPPDRPGQALGDFSRWFHIHAIPCWFVIDPDGKLAGHSMTAEDAFRIARECLAGRN